MGLIQYIKKYRLKKLIQAEQGLRERCIAYAGNGNANLAAQIYRFIVRGTYAQRDRITGEVSEYTYVDLEGVIRPAENLTK